MGARQPEIDPRVRDVMQRVRTLELRTNRLVTDTLAGQYPSAFRGRGTHFDQVREYVPGDDVRHIDWNVTARAGRPFVKEYVEERELTVLLMVDVSASGDFGSVERSKRELAAEVGCALALSAVKNNDKVGLVLFSDRVELYVPPRRGRTHALRVVREILCTPAEGRGTDLAEALTFANRVTRRRAVLFVLSDLQVQLDEALEQPLALAGARHDLVALHVRDPHERELPRVGRVDLEDAETGRVVRLSTHSRRVRERFAELALAHDEAVEGAFRRVGGDLVPLHTDRSWVPAMTRFFDERVRRRP